VQGIFPEKEIFNAAMLSRAKKQRGELKNTQW
jgi:hypothetical protein